jgi:hypothetical protein
MLTARGGECRDQGTLNNLALTNTVNRVLKLNLATKENNKTTKNEFNW